MKQGVALSVAGLSIGWLAGLSISPVIGIVITSIMGIVAAGIAVLQELQRTRSENATGARAAATILSSSSAILVAVLSCTIAIGATIGVWARTHEWLAPTEVQDFRRWTQLGVEKSAALDRLFRSRVKVSDEAGPLAHQSVLFSSVTFDSCAELVGLEGDSLRSTARASTDETVSALAEGLDSLTLTQVIGIICGRR